MRNGLTRVTGMGAGATVALAVLVLGFVFAATVVPREALATRAQALRQTLAAALPLTRAITASTAWTAISSELAGAHSGGIFSGAGRPSVVNLTAAQFGSITGQLHDDFSQGVIQLAGRGQDWAGLTSNVHAVTSSLPAVNGYAVRLEITYRQPFAQYMRLVAGRFPGSPASAQVLEVVVAQQIARQFGLHPGSTMTITGPALELTGKLAPITLDVTGIVAPRQPQSTFWTADPTLVTPDLECLNCYPQSIWYGAVIAGPGEIGAVQRDFGPEGLGFQWVFPMAFGSLAGAPVQQISDALSRNATQAPAIHGDMASLSPILQVSSALAPTLSGFLGTAQAVDTLLWLLYVSLAVTSLVALLLAARMIVLRRSAELAMRRARGASLAQVAWATGRGAAVACVPAGVAGVLLAVLAVPGPAPAGGWWPPAGALVLALCAPAAIAAWQHRLPRRRRGPRRRTRLVAEATACLAAIAGVVVLRQQAASAAAPAGGGGVNLYTSAAPLLIAIPAVILVLRVYPLLLRALLRGSARRTGATAFLGLARASRTRLTPALPAFALVLALTVAAFAGMVRDAVNRAEVAASWQAAGADVLIMAAHPNVQTLPLGADTIRALAAVPGVAHSAAMWQSDWSAPDGSVVTGIAVDPASYAALVASTSTFPPVPAGLLAAGSPQPVLASAQAAADLGAGVSTLTSGAGVAPVRVRVAGVLSRTPALPGGAAFVIMPLSALHSTATPPVPAPLNEMLLTGADIDSARLATVLSDMVPGGVTTVRSDILKGFTGAPLQHGTFILFALAIIAAAVLGLAVMLFELALGATEREATLARLATMGLGERQRARVVALEVLPAIAAAAVAAGASALVLPRVVAPAVDLSVFTGPGLGGVALAPDVASFAVPLAGLAVLAVLALVVEIRLERRHGAAASLRAADFG